ncbi:MAG TPA: aldehyde dehydrogenase family protein [Thermoanaerobaculia bacterium]|nr:aldehyde dehydrogenase family protein [Thermoanaerobaculia bacterium]
MSVAAEAKLIIDGQSVPAVDGRTSTLIEPATGSQLAVVAAAGVEDVERAVSAAARAFPGWRRVSSRERAQLLFRLAALLRQNRDELARLESRNAGKPIRDARDEVDLAANCFEYYGGAVDKVGGQTIPVAAPGVSLTFREPIGVCAIIVPWNFPIAITSWKSAPALAMGNTVVLKPAEQTPLTALRLAELMLEAGIPSGVFNVITGAGSVVGEALVKHPLVRKVSFTGSTDVGVRVMKLAADTIKRVTLELGGKSANIIFADSDIDKAVSSAVSSSLGNAGQDCCARSRVLVEQSVYDQFLEKLRRGFSSVVMGDPLREETEMGPMITAEHRERVLGYIRSGIDEGAELVCGGSAPDDPSLSGGTYIAPTIFAGAKRGMRIVREEIFGPVVAVMPFIGEQAAIEMANDSEYGLSGSIWTRDIGRALRVARAVETGVLSINTGSSVHLGAPFGGFKKSGIGRELGLAALDHYSEMKSVYIDVSG